MKRTLAKIFPALFAAAALAAPAMAADLRELLAASRTAQKTGEIILVVDRALSLWKKSDAGAWEKTLEAPCGYGKLGLTENKREGDKKTPVGAFPILHAFGNKPNPGTAMKWRPVTPNSYWADDVNQPKIYNTWVESAKKFEIISQDVPEAAFPAARFREKRRDGLRAPPCGAEEAEK